jgi:monofunctional biosynthetic peptidoglycan transglycosylase
MIWRFRRYRRRYAPKRSLLGRLTGVARWLVYALLLLLAVDTFYLTLIWPDWKRIASGPVPMSKFIERYRQARRTDASLPPLYWRPVPLAHIPPQVRRAVILAEDSRFYEHDGFDFEAFREAMDYNLEQGHLVLGASTISQQTAKNLFLSRARNPVRKWHELILTWGMEHHLSKHRILEIYLNDAEFGRGVYGVQAAAETYWHKPVSELDWVEAAELAATLPSPDKDNPATRTRRFHWRVQKILGFIERYELNRAPVQGS